MISVIIFVFSMILHPKVVFDGASAGLSAWWNIVFPSLLPFFIVSELLITLGIIHFMGALLEPVMRPLFNVPGCGSFVMVVGFTSGCPIGSMVTAKLRRKGMCTRVEAERLMSFTNNSSPLFMLVAVGVGMFGNPSLGFLIAGAHYLANLTLGFIFKYYRYGDPEKKLNPPRQRPAFRQAVQELVKIHSEEKRPLGKIIGDAVTNSVNNLLKIGGFIILFAVIIRLLTEIGVIYLLADLIALVLLPLGFDASLFPAIASGLFEVTLGTKLASEATAPLLQQLIAVAIILGWSGLSIHAQVASMIADTDLGMLPFIIARTAHSVVAGIYTYILWQWLDPVAKGWIDTAALSPITIVHTSPWLHTWHYFKIFLLIITAVLVMGLLYQLIVSVIKVVRK
ncbi:sporulation integral membrane protein YlbJ [Desulfofalx alkaliphila]|uniref:sporulation integral membrane protein YlbJ n=1 Tax=Desulfofalx alkaliphila TaxID=105483 RepID=UPI0009FF786C|nr:sporulation integral membrane protein YlbJ [Desulfofalx alkaliphila]